MSHHRSTSIELTVAAMGLLVGIAVGVWLANRPARVWRPGTVLASTRARVIGQDDNVLGRALTTVAYSAVVVKWYVDQAVPLTRSQPVLALGVILLLLGLGLHSLVDRLGSRHEEDLREADRQSARSRFNLARFVPRRHMKAGSV